MSAEHDQQEMTIDELAHATGMTVRNIRAHQSRGLLPAPEIRARTGYYGPEHLSRVRLIQTMQAEGFNLKAIQRLLDAPGDASRQILEFGRTLLTSFGQGRTEFSTAEELQQRFGGPLEVSLARKTEKLGLIRPLGDGRYEIANPVLLDAGEELISLGITIERALAVAEEIQRHSRAIAHTFVRMFMEDLVGSTDLAAHPPEDWDRLREALQRLRPLATEAVRASFEQTMSAAVERQIEKILGDG